MNTLKISGLFLERARLVSKVVVDYPELEVLILARARVQYGMEKKMEGLGERDFAYLAQVF